MFEGMLCPGDGADGDQHSVYMYLSLINKRHASFTTLGDTALHRCRVEALSRAIVPLPLPLTGTSTRTPSHALADFWWGAPASILLQPHLFSNGCARHRHQR